MIQCKDCRFYWAWKDQPGWEGEEGGLCKRYAPRPILASQSIPGGAEAAGLDPVSALAVCWPDTAADDGCGEGEKDESATARSIDDLELTVQSRNCLWNSGIRTIDDLINKTERELLRINGFGRESLRMVMTTLNDMGLELKETKPKKERKAK